MYGRLMILQSPEAHIGVFFRFRDILHNLTVPLISVIDYTLPVRVIAIFVVRSDMHQLYKVNVNGDHKTCIISTETCMFL